MKRLFTSALILVVGCAVEQTPLPEDKYERTVICVTLLSSASKALGNEGNIRDQLPFIAALINAERARDDLAADLNKSAADILTDQQTVHAELETKFEVQRALQADYTQQCLSEFSGGD